MLLTVRRSRPVERRWRLVRSGRRVGVTKANRLEFEFGEESEVMLSMWDWMRRELAERMPAGPLMARAARRGYQLLRANDSGSATPVSARTVPAGAWIVNVGKAAGSSNRAVPTNSSSRMKSTLSLNANAMR